MLLTSHHPLLQLNDTVSTRGSQRLTLLVNFSLCPAVDVSRAIETELRLMPVITRTWVLRLLLVDGPGSSDALTKYSATIKLELLLIAQLLISRGPKNTRGSGS